MRLPSGLRRFVESAVGLPEMRNQVALAEKAAGVAENNAELFAESIAELERQLVDPGWIRLQAELEQEFSLDGLRQLRAICRLYSIKNPLIKRGLALRNSYVWGQGVQIAARSDGKKEGEQDVNTVVQAFLDDDANARAFTGPAAREVLERSGLGTDGEFFVGLFTRPTTGWVQARVMTADDIIDTITNPEDRSEPWFYRRAWIQISYDREGRRTDTPMEAIHPDINYQPGVRRNYVGNTPISWDCPVLHVRVNELLGWQRGVPDVYAAIDWAKAYKIFLEDWAKLMRSLSRYAWKVTAQGSASAAVKTAVATAPAKSPVTGQSQSAGATAVISPEAGLEAISKSGAQIDADSGRPLAAMVAAAIGVPITMLLTDPGVTGARATAETLDGPTEKGMSQRRELWAGVYRRILRYVITESVRAPRGALQGTITADPISGREVVTLFGETDPTIDITWPALEDIDPAVFVKAIVDASSTGTVPPEQIARLLLMALGVRDVDAIMAQLVDDDGNFLWPEPPPVGAGHQAVDALAAGQDPAAVDGGPMAGDPGADTPPDDDGEA